MLNKVFLYRVFCAIFGLVAFIFTSYWLALSFGIITPEIFGKTVGLTFLFPAMTYIFALTMAIDTIRRDDLGLFEKSIYVFAQLGVAPLGSVIYFLFSLRRIYTVGVISTPNL